jgi:hypothetical protein
MACCDQPNMNEQDVWYRNVRAGASVMSFGSEQEALQFLSRNIDDLPPSTQQIYVALQFRRDNAES